MGRGGRTRRAIAAAGGVLINGLILAALVLVEQTPPVVEEQPVIVLELERPQRRAASRSPSAVSRAAPTSPRSSRETPASSVVESGEPAKSALAATEIDPAWRIDRQTLDRWRLTEGVPAANWGRYYRACTGLSSEHMTPDEKERCHGSWNDRKDKRPSPNFIGPIDETKWETPEPKPPSVYDKDARRQERCRDYRRGRTPGFSERNLASTGSPPPSLREKGCF
jgi:hypothetical protein